MSDLFPSEETPPSPQEVPWYNEELVCWDFQLEADLDWSSSCTCPTVTILRKGLNKSRFLCNFRTDSLVCNILETRQWNTFQACLDSCRRGLYIKCGRSPVRNKNTIKIQPEREKENRPTVTATAIGFSLTKQNNG